MARMRQRITLRLVQSLKADGCDRLIWDDDVSGFGIRVSPAGHVGYVLQYRVDGRQRRYNIGRHGSPWTPETARQEAKRLLGSLADGADPQEQKFTKRAEASMSELCDLYLAEGLLTAKASSIASARSNIENHIKPLIGQRRVTLITRADLDAVLRDVAAGKTGRRVKLGPRRLARVRGGKGAANSAMVTLSAALGFAVTRGMRSDNPAIGMRKFPEKKLERFLSPVELAKLGEALAAAEALGVENPYAITALKLLVLTGCRKNEILTLKRSQIDQYHRCLRLPDSKTGAIIVHLGAPAMQVIADTKAVAGNPFLLPGRTTGTHVTDLKTCWSRVRKAAGLKDVRIHDLRHSFASIGAGTGDSMLIIGALLGHRSAKTTQRYTHLSDHPLRSAAERISTEIARHLGETAKPAAVAGERETEMFETPERFEREPDPVLGSVIRARWLDTRAAAERLGFTVGTMQTYRWMGTGPVFRKIGRRVVYSANDLDLWLAAQRRWLGDPAEVAARAMERV